MELPTGNKPQFTKAPPKAGTLLRAEYDVLAATVQKYETEGMKALASRLGIAKHTLYFLLAKHGIKPNRVGRNRASYAPDLYKSHARTRCGA